MIKLYLVSLYSMLSLSFFLFTILFIIGFRDEGLMKGFNFPNPKPLKITMSEVWGGNCDRKIGFTWRIGGRGSNINNRRNWDSYLVDGLVKRISYVEARKMQGFPDDFIVADLDSNAYKQFGNSMSVPILQFIFGKLFD